MANGADNRSFFQRLIDAGALPGATAPKTDPRRGRIASQGPQGVAAPGAAVREGGSVDNRSFFQKLIDSGSLPGSTGLTTQQQNQQQLPGAPNIPPPLTSPIESGVPFPNVIPEITPTGDPVADAIAFSSELGKNVQSENLPFFLSLLKSNFNLPQQSEFQELQQGEIPGTVSLVDMLQQIAPGADPSQSVFQPGQFTESEFFGAKPITADILNDPAFLAFKADLAAQTGEQSQSIADIMAKRGILPSGATGAAFQKLGESGQRAISGELGRIASPLLQQSAIQQAILDPMRRTAFGQSEAGRRTAFDEIQQRLKAGGATDAISRALGLAGAETGIQQQGEDVRAGILRGERGKRQAFLDKAALLPTLQDETQLNRLSQIQNLISSALTGGQVGTSSNLGALINQQKLEQQAGQFEQGQAQQKDIATSSLIANLLPALIGAGSKFL